MTSDRIEAKTGEAINLLDQPIVVSCEVMAEGYLCDLLKGKATPVAYVKCIMPDTVQGSRSTKVQARRFKVRLKGDRLIAAMGTFEAVNSHKVKEALREWQYTPPDYKLVGVHDIGCGELWGILGDKVVKDVSSPKIKPVVALSITVATKHFLKDWISDDRGKRFYTTVVTDGETFHQVINNKIHPIDLPLHMKKDVLFEMRDAIERINRKL